MKRWSVIFLTSDDVMAINNRITGKYVLAVDGATRKEIKPGRPHSIFGRVAAFLKIEDQAREIHRAIRENRPFKDGNKRTADAARQLFLSWNGGAANV